MSYCNARHPETFQLCIGMEGHTSEHATRVRGQRYGLSTWADGSAPRTEPPDHSEPKDPWHLLPTRALRAIVRVFGFGVSKHPANDWPQVPKDVHYAALLRHLMAWREGEMFDPESKHPHLAHVGCRLLMLLELEGK